MAKPIAARFEWDELTKRARVILEGGEKLTVAEFRQLTEGKPLISADAITAHDVEFLRAIAKDMEMECEDWQADGKLIRKLADKLDQLRRGLDVKANRSLTKKEKQ